MPQPRAAAAAAAGRVLDRSLAVSSAGEVPRGGIEGRGGGSGAARVSAEVTAASAAVKYG